MLNNILYNLPIEMKAQIANINQANTLANSMFVAKEREVILSSKKLLYTFYSAIENNELFIPSNKVFIPRNETLIPSNERFIPNSKAFIPVNDALIPSTERFIPSNKSIKTSNSLINLYTNLKK